MARPAVFNWKAADASAICLLQSTGAAADLVLSGTEVTGGLVNFPGLLRSVSFTSGNNLSGVTFTVTGFYGNIPVSYSRTGPNANTVLTAQLFSTVTSVHVSAAVNAVSVGSGTTGRTNWFRYNYNQVLPSLTVAVSNVVGTVDLLAQTTLDDVNTNEAPYLFAGIVLSSTSANSFGTSITPISYASINVGITTTGSFTATFLQQGIT